MIYTEVQICVNIKGRDIVQTHPLDVQCLETKGKAGSLWAKPLLNELLIDSAEMSSLPLIIIHFIFNCS